MVLTAILRAVSVVPSRSSQNTGSLGACCTTSERARWLASNTKGDTPAAYGRMASGNNGDGGWNIKEPDWDVHACFDAVFILRQLGGDGKEVGAAIYKAA